MLRSLEAAVSGLQNHQVRMDLIGNNLANSNTIGFKSQRLTFKESFSQMLEGSTRPPGGNGGKNPIQVGLGTAIGSIDTIQTQGNIQSTGIITDLAIEGKSYFAVNNGKGGNYYTRNGSFQMDSKGHLTLPTNGMVLQGKIANAKGEFPPGTKIGDIRIPFDEQSPAQATKKVNFARNLNADSMAKGTVTQTQAYIQNANMSNSGPAAHDSTSLLALKNSKGESLNLKAGDKITVTDPAGNQTIFSVTDDPTDADLAAIAPATVPKAVYGIADVVAQITGAALTVDAVTGLPTGQVTIPKGWQVTTDAPLASSKLASAFSGSLNAAGTSFNTDSFREPAVATSLLADLYDSTGKNIYDPLSNTVANPNGNNGLQDGDLIKINANVGGKPVGGVASLAFNHATTTLQDVLDLIRQEVNLPLKDGTAQSDFSVAVNGAATDDNLIDGAIVVRGQPGEDFAITNLTIRAENTDPTTTAPKIFNANNSTTDFQKARDPGVVDTSLVIYDRNGETHNMTMTFVPTNTVGEWEWAVHFPGKEDITGGGKGKITFGQDGSVSSFTYDDNSPRLKVDPGNGADILEIELNMGGPGNFQGLTQFQAASSASAIGQDGYGTGKLSDVSIDTLGYVKGVFTNGVTKNLAQVMVVDFVNPGGLERVADSVFTTSSNSGDPVFGQPGVQTTSKLRPGALEASNVDISHEFTDMITTQRGFQANSRVITVSDSMLEELLGLKR